jgi:flagellar biogenesis protein FliO
MLAPLPGLMALTAAAQTTNSVALSSPPLPDMGLSLVRVMGALALVLALFLGAVWLFRNWQRLVLRRVGAPRLNVFETRSLGGRHALYVVGYEQERFLVAASPAGVHLVSHLQPSSQEGLETAVAAPASFSQNLARLLGGKPGPVEKAGVAP